MGIIDRIFDIVLATLDSMEKRNEHFGGTLCF